jgi:DNA-binding MarR family transcriptional regulator
VTAEDPKTRPTAWAPEDKLNDSALRGFVGYNLRRAYLTVHDDLISNLAGLELRTITFSALSMIVDNPDIIQSRLAEALRMERPNLVVVIDELEQRELITKSKLKSDRRAYALRPTLKGRRMRDRALRVVAAHEDRLLSALSAEERRNLVAMLNRIES